MKITEGEPGISDGTRAEVERLGFQQGVAYMPVPQCRWCRWWGTDGEPSGFGHCAMTAIDAVWRQSHPNSLAVVNEPGDALRTAAMFGCVQWEAKSGE